MMELIQQDRFGERVDVGRSLVYNPHAVMHPDLLPGYAEASRNARLIIRDYLIGSRKVIGSFEVAKRIICTSDRYRDGKTGNPITITEQDLIEAYAIACGGGCEYEWPHA
jgi:hypothetical protein